MTTPQPTPFVTKRRVEFSDVDMGGIVHFSRYFVFMETAEHELFRSLDLDPMEEIAGGFATWVRAAVSCQYRSPARMGDEIEIAVTLPRVGTSSVTLLFQLSCDGQAVAEGEMTVVYCRLSSDASARSTPMPRETVDRLQAFAD